MHKTQLYLNLFGMIDKQISYISPTSIVMATQLKPNILIIVLK